MTLEDLLRIAISQEAVDRQMEIIVSNAGADQVNVVGGSKPSTRGKMCFVRGRDARFSRDDAYPARGETCRKCGAIGHSKVRCPQVVQRDGVELICRIYTA